jgi:hypothetical protein
MTGSQAHCPALWSRLAELWPSTLTGVIPMAAKRLSIAASLAFALALRWNAFESQKMASLLVDGKKLPVCSARHIGRCAGSSCTLKADIKIKQARRLLCARSGRHEFSCTKLGPQQQSPHDKRSRPPSARRVRSPRRLATSFVVKAHAARNHLLQEGGCHDLRGKVFARNLPVAAIGLRMPVREQYGSARA